MNKPERLACADGCRFVQSSGRPGCATMVFNGTGGCIERIKNDEAFAELGAVKAEAGMNELNNHTVKVFKIGEPGRPVAIIISGQITTKNIAGY
jgi:hypothetical protein